MSSPLDHRDHVACTWTVHLCCSFVTCRLRLSDVRVRGQRGSCRQSTFHSDLRQTGRLSVLAAVRRLLLTVCIALVVQDGRTPVKFDEFSPTSVSLSFGWCNFWKLIFHKVV